MWGFGEYPRFRFSLTDLQNWLPNGPRARSRKLAGKGTQNCHAYPKKTFTLSALAIQAGSEQRLASPAVTSAKNIQQAHSFHTADSLGESKQLPKPSLSTKKLLPRRPGSAVQSQSPPLAPTMNLNTHLPLRNPETKVITFWAMTSTGERVRVRRRTQSGPMPGATPHIDKGKPNTEEPREGQHSSCKASCQNGKAQTPGEGSLWHSLPSSCMTGWCYYGYGSEPAKKHANHGHVSFFVPQEATNGFGCFWLDMPACSLSCVVFM